MDVDDDDDDATTEFSGSNRHEDSGVGRTDDSTRNEESSEQEMPEHDGSTTTTKTITATTTATAVVCRTDERTPTSSCNGQVSTQQSASTSCRYVDEGPSPIQCQQFYAMLKDRCNAAYLSIDQGQPMILSSSTSSSSSSSSSLSSQAASHIHDQPPPVPPRTTVTSAPTPDQRHGGGRTAGGDAEPFLLPVVSPVTSPPVVGEPTGGAVRRSVPRMGTRSSRGAAVTSSTNELDLSFCLPPPPPEDDPTCDVDDCRVDPLRTGSTMQLPVLDVQAPVATKAVSADDCRRRMSSSSSATVTNSVDVAQSPSDAFKTLTVPTPTTAMPPPQFDVMMLTNRANLRHTIAVQQDLFQRQIAAANGSSSSPLGVGGSVPSNSHGTDAAAPVNNSVQPSQHPTQPPNRSSCSSSSSSFEQIDQLKLFGIDPRMLISIDGPPHLQHQPSVQCPTSAAHDPVEPRRQRGERDGPKMEWVVKRRSDGSRYITRRPAKTRINENGDGDDDRGGGGGRSRKHHHHHGHRHHHYQHDTSQPQQQQQQQQTVTSSSPVAQGGGGGSGGSGEDVRPPGRHHHRQVAAGRREVACSTDDDDTGSELKIGRYWTRQQRRQHVEQRRQREAEKLVRKQRMIEDQQRQQTAAAESQQQGCSDGGGGWRLYDDCLPAFDPSFTSIDEILARGSRGPPVGVVGAGRMFDRHFSGGGGNQLLSVTTV